MEVGEPCVSPEGMICYKKLILSSHRSSCWVVESYANWHLQYYLSFGIGSSSFSFIFILMFAQVLIFPHENILD